LINLELIIIQCRKNNRQAQADLYNHLAPRLLGLCLRYLRDRDEAEDVMQDAFVKIFTSIHSFKGEGSFEGWARRIAVNTALDALKSKNRIHFERNLELVKTIDFTEDEQQSIDLEEIMACMDALPTGYRTIINLFLVEGFKHKEIGEKLGISESTSRSQCARARQALMKLIKEKTAATAAKNA
jgi:RNA polymerase sigma factor (sigma-70 family)